MAYSQSSAPKPQTVQASAQGLPTEQITALVTTAGGPKYPHTLLAGLTDVMHPQPMKAGETIITQGEPGRHFYLVESGSVEVWRTDPMLDETECLGILQSGEGFGEEALLQDGFYDLTVKAVSDGALRRLDKQHFDTWIKPRYLREVEPEQAHQWLARNCAALVDCRYEIEFESGSIPEASLLPLDQIRQRFGELDPRRTYIVYCRSGRRSKAAAYLLRQRGLDAYSMRDGINGWSYEVVGDALSH